MTNWCPWKRGGALFKARVLFLLVSIATLSALAKQDRYLPNANPARHVSKIVRMEETTVPPISKPVVSGWVSAVALRRLPARVPAAFAVVEPPPIACSATAGAELLRSPPVIFS